MSARIPHSEATRARIRFIQPLLEVVCIALEILGNLGAVEHYNPKHGPERPLSRVKECKAGNALTTALKASRGLLVFRAGTDGGKFRAL
jgi:hypothetical protein